MSAMVSHYRRSKRRAMLGEALVYVRDGLALVGILAIANWLVPLIIFIVKGLLP